MQRIVVIGGVAAGPSAAAKARRCAEKADIKLFERGPNISYAGCALPYYVSGIVKDRRKMLVVTPEEFRARHNVDLRVQHEAVAVDPAARQVTVRDLVQGKEEVFPYDALILATGASPFVPPIPGAKLPNIFTLRTVPDADRIREMIATKEPKHAVVVGAGLIGLEMVEALEERGIQVALVELFEHVLPPLDADMAYLVEKKLRKKGVRVVTGDAVTEFVGDEQGVRVVRTRNGLELAAELVIMSVGVRPNVELAVQAGVALGANGTIAVNERMETNVPGIYAAGDCAESYNIITGEKVWSPLGSVANKQGRTAGANAAGGEARFGGVTGSLISRIWDLSLGCTGLSEREARQRGLDVEVIHVHPTNLAGVFPGAQALAVKVIADRRSGRLLGGQVVGGIGTDKRLDVMATALKGQLTVDELFDIDYAYAPPFSPAKDPVAVAGIVTSNVLKGDVHSITASELWEWIKRGDDLVLLDVRTPKEYQHERIADAVNVELDALRERIGELDAGKNTVVYCRQGLRGFLAARILQQCGFEQVSNLSGGMLSWQYQVEKGPVSDQKAAQVGERGEPAP